MPVTKIPQPQTTKISVAKLMGMDDGGDSLGKVGQGSDKAGALARIVRHSRIKINKNEKAIAINAKDITDLKTLSPGDDEESNNIESINGSLDSILETLKEDHELKKEKAEEDAKDAQDKKRGIKERLLEGTAKVWDGAKKVGSTILKPFTNVWEQIKKFISTVILGNIITRLVKWLSNPENTDKIKSIIKFVEDFWPSLLAGYLLFGNALGRFITTIGLNLVKWSVKLLLKVIPALFKALAAMGPWGAAAALGIGAVGVAAWLGRNKEGDQPPDPEGGDQSGGGENQLSTTTESSGGGENQPVVKMNKGGVVPGSGNTDSVPAMLTPGEFVMSKGAVQKYGSDTLAGMNAAAGGTNRPTPSGGYNRGGKAFDRSHYGTMGYQIGQIQPDTLVVSRTSSTEKMSEHIGKGAPGGADYDTFSEDVDMNMPGRNSETVKFKEGSLVGEESFEQDIATIGVPDFMEHKDQLLSELHAVPGYENITIEDVINSRVNMPLKQYLPILMRSDAQQATFAKQAAAHQRDKQIRGIKEGEGYSMGYDFKGGGLVPISGFAGGGSVGKISSSKKSASIGPPTKRNPSTIVADMRKQTAVTKEGGKLTSGSEIPPFNPAAKRSAAKMEVLGITV